MQNIIWQLQTAKNKFSEVVKNAMVIGPQLVTKNGKPAVYIISFDEYQKMKSSQLSKKEVLMGRPHKDVEIKIPKSKDIGREINL